MSKVVFYHRSGRVEKMSQRFADILEKLGRGYSTRMMQADIVTDIGSYEPEKPLSVDPVVQHAEPESVSDEPIQNELNDSTEVASDDGKKKRGRKKKDS